MKTDWEKLLKAAGAIISSKTYKPPVARPDKHNNVFIRKCSRLNPGNYETVTVGRGGRLVGGSGDVKIKRLVVKKGGKLGIALAPAIFQADEVCLPFQRPH